MYGLYKKSIFGGVFMKKFLSIVAICLMVLGVSFSEVFAQVSIPREDTVYCIGAIWGPPTTWNLYAPQSTWGTDHFLYMPLFFYSNAKDAWLPGIGESYKVVNKTTLQVKIRDVAKWSDGKPITAEDVEFTFNTTKRFGFGPGTGWYDYIASVKAVSEKVVEFKIRTDKINYYSFMGYSLGTRVLPKHIYEDLEKKGQNIRDWANDDPAKQVVSGPYKLFFQDPNNVIYERLDNWWGKDIFGLPKPKYIAHIIYKDNASANLAFEKGDSDWAGTFIPEVYALWEKKGLPIRTWFKSKPYYMPDGIVFLYISYQNPVLKDPNIRKAIAYAVPYADMLEKAYFNYSSQAHPSMVIDIFDVYKQWIDYTWARTVWKSEDGRVKTDLTTANKILDSAGYKRGKDGIRVTKDGKRLGPYTISVPYGWTDWMMMCEMIAKNLRDIGIDIKTEFPDYSVWADRMTKGTFDFIISWSAGPGYDHPWNVYRFVLDQRLSKPFGEETWAGDWVRYNNPEIPAILDKIASSLKTTEKKSLYSKLQRIVYRDLPAIPLFYGAHWYAFNESKWVGWPKEENAWWYPSAPWSANNFPILFGIAKKGETPKVPAWLTTKDKGGYLIPTSQIWNDFMRAK